MRVCMKRLHEVTDMVQIELDSTYDLQLMKMQHWENRNL